jgi:hypothetical protein
MIVMGLGLRFSRVAFVAVAHDNAGGLQRRRHFSPASPADRAHASSRQQNCRPCAALPWNFHATRA